ncbi:unnamed protein product [Sphagnum troendelagicum]|uniref:C3H1-type domain-containing protein n=1 Tax=Sphagnum troendelagicum TaxID=128251 RepID=A0ABP0UGX0_9BRYO
MDPFGPPRKRPRPETVPYNGVNGHGPAAGQAGDPDYKQDGSGNRTKPCTKFFSTSGCPYGEGCHFLHFVPGGIQGIGMGALAPLSNVGSMGSTGTRKVVGGLGPDDQGANLGGFKTRLCNRFDTAEGCRFGEKCHFAHGEMELRKSNSSTLPPLDRDVTGMGSYREPTPPGMAAAASFGASSTAKISIEASLAGAIIGKGGINAKQICRLTGAKISIREHESDPTLRNVEMEGSFEQIKQASQMVREVLMHRDNVPSRPASGFGSHNFKTKLCENYSKGTCTFGDRCHFAHGSAELREPLRV